MDSLLMLKKWFKGMENAPDEVLDMYGGRMLRLLLGKEIDDSNDDWQTQQIWSNIKKDTLGTYNAYQVKKEYGEQHGKKMDPASILTWQYCQEHPQAKAQDVYEFLLSKGIDKKSSSKKGPYSKIYDLEGWKKKADVNWGVEKISEDSFGFSNQNSEEIERDSDGIPIF